MGYCSSRHEAEDGRRCRRETPSHSDVEAWLSRSTSSTRRRVEARAAARLTAIVDLPTPPLLFSTAIITGNLSGILARIVCRAGLRRSAGGCAMRAPAVL